MDFLEISIDINKLKKLTAGLFDKIEGNRERLNKALEKGTAVAFHGIYHETINKRISAICNALGMDLNGSISPKLTALEKKSENYINMASNMTKHYHELKLEIAELQDNTNRWVQNYNTDLKELKEEQRAFIEVCQEPCKDCKLNDLEILLRDHIQLDSSDPDLLNYNTYEAYNDALLVKLDAKQEKKESNYTPIFKNYNDKDLGGEKEGDCGTADIKGKLQQFPADSKLPKPTMISGSKRPKCKECGNLMKLDIMTLNKSDWYCPICKKLPDSCKECGGYRMGEKMMHKNWCSQCTTSTTQTDFTDLLLSDHKIHELKTIPRYFKPLLERTKNFEIRINDRDFKVGDFLKLKEYNYEIKNDQIIGYTGRELVVVVTYILRAEGSFFSFLDDYIIMAIRHLKK